MKKKKLTLYFEAEFWNRHQNKNHLTILDAFFNIIEISPLKSCLFKIIYYSTKQNWFSKILQDSS